MSLLTRVLAIVALGTVLSGFRDRDRLHIPKASGANFMKAEVQVDGQGEGKISRAPLQPGVRVWSNTDRYQWTEVALDLQGFEFTQFDNHHKGVTSFTVRTPGRVYLAVTSRWGGGGAGGAWNGELTSKEDFLAQGWEKLTTLTDTAKAHGHGYDWILYQREFQGGEVYRLRTEKYCAPILLFPPG